MTRMLKAASRQEREAILREGYVVGRPINSGAFGRVYVADKNSLIRIEQIHRGRNKREAVVEGLELNKRLGAKHIAPAVKDSFHIPKQSEDDEDVIGYMVMVMDRYTMNLQDFLGLEPNDTTLLGMNVSHLFRRLAREYILCLDLKPSNIVLNVDKEHGVWVPKHMRLIDFGGDFCSSVYDQLDGHVFEDNDGNEATATPKQIEDVIYACLLFMYFLNMEQYEEEHAQFCLHRLCLFRNDPNTKDLLQTVDGGGGNQFLYLAMKKLLTSHPRFASICSIYANETPATAMKKLYRLMAAADDGVCVKYDTMTKKKRKRV
jgi:hypothetical protein